MKIPN